MRELKLYYSQFDSQIGRIYLAKTQLGLRFIALNRREWFNILTRLRKEANLELKESQEQFLGIRRQLEAYFSGENRGFKISFDLDGATSFQKKVWSAMSQIPYGQTRSYQWLAKKVKIKSPRAVGQACASNPLPIVIPCHRVISSDGTLGGYGGGLPKKIKLLKLEGALSQ